MNAGIYALPIALILCGFIIFAEMIRHHKRFQIDLLFGVSVIYLICFGIVPVFIFKTDLSYYSDMHWIKRIPLEDSAYLFAAITSLIGYVLILTGYYFAKRVRISRKIEHRDLHDKKNKSRVNIIYPEKKMSFIGMLLFLIGTLSLIIYVVSIGGIKTALETATLYRSGKGPTASRWLFLKNVAPLVIIASYFYYTLRLNETNKRKKYTIMFIISFIISLYLLMLLSGGIKSV